MTLDPFNAFLHLDPQPGDGGPVIAVKDVIDVAGMPTTAASKVLYREPHEDAECVARLRAAGATIAGKLNTHEFAYGASTTSPHFGPALNPWNPEHICGGSSGGSGAAVAAGLVDASLGTDTAGSVRIPAAFCGVTGIRPSWGLVSTRGVVPTAWSLDTVGPLARSAEECERLLETMADRPLGGRQAGDDLRVGILTSLFERAEPAVATRVRAGARRAAGPKGASNAPAPRRPLDGHAADHAPGGHERSPAVAAHEAGRLRRRRPGAAAGRPAAAVDRVHHRLARASLGARRVRARARVATTCSWHRPCRSRLRDWTRSPRTTASCSCPTTRRRRCSGCRRSAFPVASSTACR